MKTLTWLILIILFIITFVVINNHLTVSHRNLYIYSPAKKLKQNDKKYRIIARGLACINRWIGCEYGVPSDKDIDEDIFIVKIKKKKSKLFFKAHYKYPYNMITINEPIETIEGYYEIKTGEIIITYDSYKFTE